MQKKKKIVSVYEMKVSRAWNEMFVWTKSKYQLLRSIE